MASAPQYTEPAAPATAASPNATALCCRRPRGDRPIRSASGGARRNPDSRKRPPRQRKSSVIAVPRTSSTVAAGIRLQGRLRRAVYRRGLACHPEARTPLRDSPSRSSNARLIFSPNVDVRLSEYSRLRNSKCRITRCAPLVEPQQHTPAVSKIKNKLKSLSDQEHDRNSDRFGPRRR